MLYNNIIIYKYTRKSTIYSIVHTRVCVTFQTQVMVGHNGSYYSGTYSRRPGKSNSSTMLSVIDPSTGIQVGPTISLDKKKRWETVPAYFRENSLNLQNVKKGQRDPNNFHDRSPYDSTYASVKGLTYHMKHPLDKKNLGKWKYHQRSMSNNRWTWKGTCKQAHKDRRKDNRSNMTSSTVYEYY